MGYLSEKIEKGENNALNIYPSRKNRQKKTASKITPNEYIEREDKAAGHRDAL